MAYYKQWRKCHSEVRLLAESSTSGDEDLDREIQVLGTDSGEHLEDLEHNNLSFSPDMSDNEDSDCGFLEGVISSDDSDLDNIHSDSDVENERDIGEDVASWATRNKCSRSSLNEILEVLRYHGHRVPKDARTLLKTPRRVHSVNKCGGQYAYFGLETGILQILSQNQSFSEKTSSIDAIINIDGVPLFKSSSTQLWPILCSFNIFGPFIVALFCGSTKPNSVDEYLNDFVHEIQDLTENGISHGNKLFQFTVKAFVCDAPARAFLKCTKNHNGYYACERCTIKGTWNKRVILETNEAFPLRTEESFISVSYAQHQIRKSPLIDIGISCIRCFSLDYMHLVCLGVVKRLLCFLKRGPKQCRQSFRQMSCISDNLAALNGKMPSEFARQPRSLLELDRWKATELRQFVLYTGPLVLRNVVSDNIYKHFLTLTVALSIMLDSDDDKRNSYLGYANELIVYFVKKCKDIYGDTFTVYNVHSLTHLHEDVEFFKCSLNDISAFQFENHLQSLKKSVRKAENPIAQIAKRQAEFQNANAKPNVNKGLTMYVSTKMKDSCFLLNTEHFAFVREKRQDGKLVCDVLSQRHMELFFDNPCDSKLLNIAYINIRNMRERSKRMLLERDQLYRKAAFLPYNEGHVIFPLLHSIEKN